MFEQVHSEKFYLQIVNQIRDLIIQGKLKAGDKLPPKRDLAQQFGASPACIREALAALEVLGLIECRRGQGDFIRIDRRGASGDRELLREIRQDHSPYEILEARMEIEPVMAALAVLHATDEDIVRLRHRLEVVNTYGREAEINPDKVDEFMEEDREFHLEISRASHNSVLFTVSSGVNLMMKEKLWKAIKKKSLEQEGAICRFEVEHTAILEAIQCREGDLARALVRKHIEDIERELLEDGENV